MNAVGYEAVRARLEEARAKVASTDEPQWTVDQRAGWLQALDAIERFLDGDDSERGFSVVRSLDAGPGTSGATSAAILAVATELRLVGVDRYR